MVAELSASISFLLGLSAIAIYDWLIAFGLWVAARLRMNRFCAGEKDKDAEGLVLEGGDGDVPLTQSVLLRLQVLHELEKRREQEAAEKEQAESAIWHVEPGVEAPGAHRSRRESIRLPDIGEEKLGTPAVSSPGGEAGL